MRRYQQTYTYDLVDNLLTMTHAASGGGWTRRYQYDGGSNRLQSTSLPGDPSTGSLPVRYPHDDNGNITAMPHVKQITWDFKDRIRSVDRTGGGTVQYSYDSEGRRIRKVVLRPNGSREREQLYLGPVELDRFYAADGLTRTVERQTHHVQPGRPASVETRTHGADAGAQTLVRYQLTDVLGSSILELDGTGAVITAEEYHPFGTTSYQAVRSQTETPKRYRFTGKQRDDETGLSNHGARLYATWLGRWVSADPTGLGDGPNLYAYAHNNPIGTTDPTGRDGFANASTEGKYAHRVTYKDLDAYWASDAGSEHTVNPDGSVTANVYKSYPPVTIAPQKPVPKAAPAKPKPAPKPKAPDKPYDIHDLVKLAEALQPHLVYPKPVRQFFGFLQTLGGGVEVVGGTVGAVVTSETVVGAVAFGAVALHGVDQTTSGWTLMTTGEASKTWVFMAGAGYASMVTDDRDMQNAIGESTELIGNIAVAGHGMYTLGTSSVKLPGVAAGGLEDVSLGARINTGQGPVANVNCGFCSAAGADAVPSTSTAQAAFSGLREGPTNPGMLGRLLEGRGLGNGIPDVAGGSIADAKGFMAGWPKGTKFVVAYSRTTGGMGHVINGRIGTFGLYFIDNQPLLGGLRPFFRLEPTATGIYVFTVYVP